MTKSRIPKSKEANKKPKIPPKILFIKRLPGIKAANLKIFSIKTNINSTILELSNKTIVKEIILRTFSDPEIKPENQS